MAEVVKYAQCVSVLKKIASSQQSGATADSQSEDEHVISITERPSQLRTNAPQTARPPRRSSQAARQSARVPSATARGHDVNQQLVDRIDQLYRQTQQTPERDATTTA